MNMTIMIVITVTSFIVVLLLLMMREVEVNLNWVTIPWGHKCWVCMGLFKHDLLIEQTQPT